METLQKLLNRIIGFCSGYIAASMWIGNDKPYFNLIPVVFLCITMKFILNEKN